MFVKVYLSCFTNKQCIPVEKLEFYMVKKKIEKVQNMRYISSGTALSLTTFFQVPKGYIHTCLVYDLTSCCMNEALWDTKLWIPYVEEKLDTDTHSTWFVDVDTSEMFHNYKLSEKDQPYVGVNFYWDKK